MRLQNERRAERLCRSALHFMQGYSSFIYFEGYCASRYMKVTIWARVQGALGLNVVALVPEVIPSATAQATASA